MEGFQTQKAQEFYKNSLEIIKIDFTHRPEDNGQILQDLLLNKKSYLAEILKSIVSIFMYQAQKMTRKMPELIHEDDWIDSLRENFSEISTRIRPDADFVNKFVNLQLGDNSLRAPLNFQMFNIWNERFLNLVSLTNEGNCQISKLKTDNFQLAVLLKLVEMEFGPYRNVKTQLESLMGKQKLVGMEGLTKIDRSRAEQIFPIKFRLVYLEKGQILYSFLRKPEFSILILLFILLKNTSNQAIFHRILLKKFVEDPDFKGIWSDPEVALNYFLSKLIEFAQVLDTFVKEGMEEQS